MASYSLVVSKQRAPANSKTGIPIVADTRQMTVLARDLRRASPEAWKACRVALRAAGQVVADDAKQRASFSTRIPGSIKVRVARGNVKVVAGGPAAPNAAPLENKGRAGKFRHPVFGDRERWVDQPARPFLAPALEAHREEVAKAIEDAVYAATVRVIGGR